MPTRHDRPRSPTAMAPRVPLDVFRQKMSWGRDQHVTLLAPTGNGKTTTIIALLADRDWVVYVSTKRQDKTVDKLVKHHGYKVASNWEETHRRTLTGHQHTRWVLRCPPPDLTNTRPQKAVILEVMNGVFNEGAWTIVLDETEYLSESLGLAHEIKVLLAQGRSMNVSVVCATQRPAWIPLACYSQATWVLLGKTSDARDLQRLSELGGTVNTDALRELLPDLEEYQWCAVNTRTGQMWRTRVPANQA